MLRCLLILFLVFPVLRVAADEPMKLYNQSVELVKADKLDEAVEILRQTAAAQDEKIIAASSALLAKIAVKKARRFLADHSDAPLTAEQQQEILKNADAAEAALMDSLSVKENPELRTDLEQLRAWRSKSQTQWEEEKRVLERQAEFQQRVKQLDAWQSRLIESTEQTKSESVSPKRFQMFYEAAKEQKTLTDELTFLQDSPPPVNDEEDVQIQENLKHLPEIQQTAAAAVQNLEENDADTALARQKAVQFFLKSLLKKQKDQQNDQNNQENQEQQNQQENQQQDKSKQDKQNEQDKKDEQNKDEDVKNQKNQKDNKNQSEKQSQEQETNQAESVGAKQDEKKDAAKEKAEQMILQVRRKQQEAEKRREQIKAMQNQLAPTEKDW